MQIASLLIPVAFGELIDKITILEIKYEQISDAAKRNNVALELQQLMKIRDTAITEPSKILSDMTAQLKKINQEIWDIEDAIRECERQKRFDDQFIAIARSVYHTNDRRAALKRDINLHFGSALIEEKSYTPY